MMQFLAKFTFFFFKAPLIGCYDHWKCFYTRVFFSCTTKINPGSEMFYAASINLRTRSLVWVGKMNSMHGGLSPRYFGDV